MAGGPVGTLVDVHALPAGAESVSGLTDAHSLVVLNSARALAAEDATAGI